MQASKVLSRWLPVAEGDSISVYDSVRRDGGQQPDLEAQPRPLEQEPFHDEDSDPEGLLYDQQHEVDTAESANTSPEILAKEKAAGRKGKRRADEDEDVPESLLLEDKTKPGAVRPSSSNVPTSSQVRTEAQWKAAQRQHGLHSQFPRRQAPRSSTGSGGVQLMSSPAQADPKATAMWQYTNASNLDAFLLEVYQYYVEHGFYSILLSKAISLSTELFVFSFAMFLTTCIDYTKIPSSKSTPEVLIPQCMAKASWLKNVALFVFIVYWCTRLAAAIGSVRRRTRMRNFYQYVLGINDEDIQTVSWVRVVDGLIKLHNANIATADPSSAIKKYAKYSKAQQRMNAETIANRLMRQANYYVALYNKDILDFTLPIPFKRGRQFYSKSLEWGIDFCLTNFIFDEQGSIRPFCLDVKNRRVLVEALQTRLQFAAVVSIIVAPVNIIRFCIVYFFRYYTEFSRNPSKASARSFTPYAEWKMREFNELDHLFQRRLRQAYQPATQYLRQFPKDKTDQVSRFVAFISGALAAVLALATLFDPELFLGFEVTPGRTAVFYLTVLIGVFGVAHGSLPDDDEVHDPVLHLRAVLYYTHYIPSHWRDRLHTTEVRTEFSAMYQLKFMIFFEEIVSLIVAPLILYRNAGKRSERLIDFFREQTVHVDGIGYQCNFAVFGFKKDINAVDPNTLLEEPDGLRDEYYGLKDDKMAASVQNFMQYYSHYNRKGSRKQGWQPPPTWPPMSTEPIIAEEGGAAKAAAIVPAIKRADYGSLYSRANSGPRSPGHLARTIRDRRVPATQQRYEQMDRTTTIGSPLANGVSESVMMQNDSDLHDMVQPEKEAMESDSESEEGADKVGGAGVLGMLYQFSKAQTDKGTGVNI